MAESQATQAPERRQLVVWLVVVALAAIVLVLGARGCGDESPAPPPGPSPAASRSPAPAVTTYALDDLPAPVRAPRRTGPPREVPDSAGPRSVTIDGSLGDDMGGGLVTVVPDLTQQVDAARDDPQALLAALDAAAPEALAEHLRARANILPHVAPMLAAPPDAPRAMLVHLATLAEAILTRERLEAEHGPRLPLDAAVRLAELNLAVAERGLNDAALQAELDADLVEKLGPAGPDRLDEAFAAAEATLDRVTQPGPPPEDPRALAREQASAYYRVLALAALRLEQAGGQPVPGLTPAVSAVFDPADETPDATGGIRGAVEQGGR